jgi:hypothetical protein
MNDASSDVAAPPALAQGVFGMLTGGAAAVGSGIFGFVAHRFGDAAAILSMAAGIAAGGAFLWRYLPETRPRGETADTA